MLGQSGFALAVPRLRTKLLRVGGGTTMVEACIWQQGELRRISGLHEVACEL